MSPSKVSNIDWSTFHNVIAGELRGSKSTHNGINPATGEKLWDVPIATEEDVNDAVKAAKATFKTWKKTALSERHDRLNRFVEVYQSHEDELLKIFCAETGKPAIFAKAEFAYMYDFAKWFATADIKPDVYEDDEKTITTNYTPLGVVGAICPWNFPILLCVGKIAPAIVAGNPVIVKPSPYTPYTTLKMIELMQEVFPVGLVQVVGGSDALGPMLTAHPDIAKISFTGSIPTGKKVMAACAATLKRVTLELGGNDATIILPDVDVDKVAPQVAMAAFINSGQVCIATKRIYIHESIYDKFLAKLVETAKSYKVGSSHEQGVMLGPVQNGMQYEKVKSFFKDSADKGYKFAAGEKSWADGKGYFIQPTIIDNPPNDSKIIREEPFGPIVPCQPWSDEDEVIERANDTNTGLGACVWGKDVARAERIGMQLESGNVYINHGETINPMAFFSGQKESGVGGEWGKIGLLQYCNPLVMHSYKSGA